MRTIEYEFVDKSDWGEGPWKKEPDKIQWPDEATGLPCLIVRHPELGHLCGYVGVPEGHPCFEVQAGNVQASAHRGLDYAGFCQQDPDGSEYSICHIAGPGESAHVWWLGFNCGDGMYALHPAFTAKAFVDLVGHAPPDWLIYSDIEYVKQEVRGLARQLKEQS